MATASNPRTTGRFIQRTFDHLLVRSPKRSSQGVPTRVQSKPQFVHVHDRIPLWNISRGDRVRVISGSRKGKIGTVDYVDRERNRIFLNELEFCRPKAVPSQHKHSIFNDPDFRPNQTVLNQIPIHYSNVQLVLQRSPEQLAADQAAQENPNAPLPEVVAKRLRAVGPHYDWRGKGRWTWKRLAATVAEIEPKTGHTHAVDWPREQRFAKFIPTTRPLPMTAAAHDSAVSTAVQSTFVPSPTPVENPPPELAIRDIEFFNPNGRARKAKRYKAKKEAAAQLAKGGKGHAERPSSQPASAPATPVSFLEA